MPSDLEALASKGKQQRQKQKRERRTAARRELNSKKQSVLKATLHDRKYMFFVYGIAVVGTVPFLINHFIGDPSLTVPLMVGGMVLAIGSFYWFKDYAMLKEVGWVSNLEIGLDPESYLRSLYTELGDNGTMKVSVEFAEAVDQEAGQLVADAALGACDAASSQFNGAKLFVVSKPKKTSFQKQHIEHGGSRSYSSNRLLHQWFKQLTNEALLAIHQRHPIAKVTVDLNKASG